MKTTKARNITSVLAASKLSGLAASGGGGSDMTAMGTAPLIRPLLDQGAGGFLRKTAFLYLFVFVAVSTLGCAAAIEKEGYLEQGSHTAHTDCSKIAITKDLPFAEEQMTVVGKIRASDGGLSAKCSEELVLDIFRQEACAQGADVIHITQEKHPNFMSTCYRAEAEFVRFTDREIAGSVDSDVEYSKERIAQSTRKTECLNNGIFPAILLGGAIGGAIHHGICNSSDSEESVSER